MEGVIGKLRDGIVLSDIYASLIATLVLVLFIADFGGSASPEAALIIFSGAFVIYAFNRQVDTEIDAINNPKRTAFLATNRLLVLVPSVALFAVLATHALLTNLALFAVMLMIFVASIFYSFPVIPPSIGRHLGFSRFKEAIFLKNASVGAMYGMCALIPALVLGLQISLALFVLFIFVAIRFFIVSVVFDLRDVEGDSKLGIMTVPLALGKEHTASMLQWLNAASLVLVLAAFFFSAASRLFLAAVCLTVLYGSYYIGESRKKDADLGFICGYLAEADIVPAALATVILLVTGLA